MNVDKYWDVTEYIVQTSGVHRLSSLDMKIKSEAINNYTSFHSSQYIWVKNLSTKKACCLKFNDLDVSFKAGNLMKVISNRKTGKIIRLINTNTGEWDQSGSFVQNENLTLLSFFYHGIAIFAAFLVTLLGVLIGPVIFLYASFIIYHSYKTVDMCPVSRELFQLGVSCLLLTLFAFYSWRNGIYGYVGLEHMTITNLIMTQIVVLFYMRLIRKINHFGEQVNTRLIEPIS
jgi:hypothetical protein